MQATTEGRDPLLVVVEVKGAWHDDVDTAMKSQLVEDYLSNQPSAAGVYLVAWSRADGWAASTANERTRRRKATSRSLEDSQAFLDAQALELEGQTSIPLKAFVLD